MCARLRAGDRDGGRGGVREGRLETVEGRKCQHVNACAAINTRSGEGEKGGMGKVESEEVM